MREGRSAQCVSRWGTDVRYEGEEMEHVLRGKGAWTVLLGTGNHEMHAWACGVTSPCFSMQGWASVEDGGFEGGHVA